jgi:NADP-dependent 3-hydroxy acid dehydrogenase YdfG
MTDNFTQSLEQKISGLTILITGGTTGIGRETALQLAEMGANVLICGHDEQHLQDTLNGRHEGSRRGALNGIIADTSTAEGIAKIFEESDSLFGSRLDVLINNAAIAYQSILDGTYDDWKKVIDTNLLGYMACTRQAIDRMINSGGGHIIHIGSMSADVHERGSSVYVATKSGIQGFSESLRKEVNEKGVKVTLIEPGAVDTDMQPKETSEKHNPTDETKMLRASDIASAIIYTLVQDKRCDVVEIRVRPHLQLI